MRGRYDPTPNNEACKNCGMEVKDTEDAVYDGEDWYCDARCHGQHMGRLSGNVPA